MTEHFGYDPKRRCDQCGCESPRAPVCAACTVDQRAGDRLAAVEARAEKAERERDAAQAALVALREAAQRFVDAVADDNSTCRDNGIDSAQAVEDEWQSIEAALALASPVEPPSEQWEPERETSGEPGEAEARRAIGRFFAEFFTVVRDGGGWSFYLNEDDTTSYVHADGKIEWYGAIDRDTDDPPSSADLADERERCARECEAEALGVDLAIVGGSYEARGGVACAARIRALGPPERDPHPGEKT